VIHVLQDGFLRRRTMMGRSTRLKGNFSIRSYLHCEAVCFVAEEHTIREIASVCSTDGGSMRNGASLPQDGRPSVDTV